MIKLIQTNAINNDFVALVKLLDQSLSVTDGDEHEFYDQYNKLDQIEYVIIGYHDKKAVGCGAIKVFNKKSVEVKRMFVIPEYRGMGVASEILLALESWATELSFERCILETGIRQPDAIGCYEKNNYKKIANYGQYQGVNNSICFQKIL